MNTSSNSEPILLHPKREKKLKLDYRGQISKLSEKNIEFDIMSESEALSYLENKNYYFKLTSYRSNFEKQGSKYQNLEFAYLVDLANIDAQLRRFIITTSLNTEHAMKVALLRNITNDPNEDGYNIVDNFKNQNSTIYEQALLNLAQSSYSKDMSEKHRDDPSIWVLMEVLTFGGLGRFIDFYSRRKPTKTMRLYSKLFKLAKNLRNASAHSTPLLINLFTDKERIDRPIPEIVRIVHNTGITRSDLQDMKVNDLTSLFILTKYLNSRDSNEHIAREAKKVIKRFDKHAEYYENVPSIQRFKNLFEKLVVFLETS